MSNCMPKEQREYIEKIQKDCLESTNMTESEAYSFAFRCWQMDYVKQSAEYKYLEEQGLLLKLPCKIGDETYWIDDEDEDGNKGLCVKGKSYVEAIGVDKDGFLISAGDGSWDRPNKSRWCFLTKEEAEQELKRLECAE